MRQEKKWFFICKYPIIFISLQTDNNCLLSPMIKLNLSKKGCQRAAFFLLGHSPGFLVNCFTISHFMK